MEILELLLSEEDFRNKELKSPYIYKISKENKNLFYFGGNHSHDTEE